MQTEQLLEELKALPLCNRWIRFPNNVKEYYEIEEGQMQAILSLLSQSEALSKPTDLSKIIRVEVIDEKRTYTNWDKSNKVKMDIQDKGQTLKIFITKK